MVADEFRFYSKIVVHLCLRGPTCVLAKGLSLAKYKRSKTVRERNKLRIDGIYSKFNLSCIFSKPDSNLSYRR